MQFVRKSGANFRQQESQNPGGTVTKDIKPGNMECENEKYGLSTPVSLFCPKRSWRQIQYMLHFQNDCILFALLSKVFSKFVESFVYISDF